MIARVLVAAAIVWAAVCAGCRPSVGHPLIRIRSADKRLRKYELLAGMHKVYVASDDVRWLYNVISEQPTSTSDAALLVRVPASLGGFGCLKRNQ